MVLFAIALLDSAEGVSTSIGLAALKRYLLSLGRYPQAGALLLPVYGACEVAQAFCRLAAVHGALYVLRCPAAALLLEQPASEGGGAPPGRRVRGVRLASGQELRCAALAGSAPHLMCVLPPQPQAPWHARAVAVLSSSLVDGKDNVLLVLPPGPGRPHAVRVMQLGQSSATAPAGAWTLFLSARGCAARGAEATLRPALDDLLAASAAGRGSGATAVAATLDAGREGGSLGGSEGGSGEQAAAAERPRLLWALFFEQHEPLLDGDGSTLPCNAVACPPPGLGASCLDDGLEKAAVLWGRLYPGEPFLPEPLSDAPAGVGALHDPDAEDEAGDAALLLSALEQVQHLPSTAEPPA